MFVDGFLDPHGILKWILRGVFRASGPFIEVLFWAFYSVQKVRILGSMNVFTRFDFSVPGLFKCSHGTQKYSTCYEETEESEEDDLASIFNNEPLFEENKRASRDSIRTPRTLIRTMTKKR